MTKPRILLIQSAQTQGNGAKRFLEERGYKVIWAGSGLTALMMASNVAIDLIVLDVALPDIEGLELCRRFRQGSDTHAIPIILLTTRGYTPELVKRSAVGPDDYLAKPYTASELDSRIIAVLETTARARPATTVVQAPSKEPDPPRPPKLYAESVLLPEPTRAMITVTQQARKPDFHPAQMDEPVLEQRQEPAAGADLQQNLKRKPDLKAVQLYDPGSEVQTDTPAKPDMDSPAASPLLPYRGTVDSVVDPETGLFGRPQFEAMFTKEFKRALRFKQQMSCMLIDLDGQQRGRRADAALVTAIIGLVQKTIREVDTAAWWSGESLIVLLPNTIRHDALQAAARILEAVACHTFTLPDAENVTMSIGVAGLPDPHLDTEQKLIEAASAARRRAQDLMVPSPDHTSFLKKR